MFKEFVLSFEYTLTEGSGVVRFDPHINETGLYKSRFFQVRHSKSSPPGEALSVWVAFFSVRSLVLFVNCSFQKLEWLSRPNIAISEMASTLKDNWTNIMAYRGTVFMEDFVDDLRRFVDPITDALRRVDNKDKLDTDPPDANDVLQILKAINFDPWVEDLFTDAFNAVGPVLMMSIHVLVINCLMHNPDAFAERTVQAPMAEKFKADRTLKNMMKYLIDQILTRWRTVKRTTNDWDSAAYLQDEEEDTQQQRPSRSRRTLAHPNPTSRESSAGPSTSRRRVPVPSTSTERGSTSRRRRKSFEVSGITALPQTDDEDDQPLARPRQKTRSLPSPVEEEDEWSQDNQMSNRTAKKNKRPLNGRSLAKNRRQVLNVKNDEDEEAEIFITQATPPKKKNKKKRRRSLSPQPPAVTTSSKTTNDNEEVPQPEDAETTSKKKHKKHKNKEKPHQALAKLISDQDEVLRQLAKGNRK